jgi:hypothetical protein
MTELSDRVGHLLVGIDPGAPGSTLATFPTRVRSGAVIRRRT